MSIISELCKKKKIFLHYSISTKSNGTVTSFL